jgi:hypothetical protein
LGGGRVLSAGGHNIDGGGFQLFDRTYEARSAVTTALAAANTPN